MVLIWAPPAYAAIFWYMFAIIIYVLYIFIVYAALHPRKALYCRCCGCRGNGGSGAQECYVHGSMRYYGQTLVGGLSGLVVISIILLVVRLLNGICIGYYLQVDTHGYELSHVATFILYAGGETLFVMFFTVLYATSFDGCRYLFLVVFHLGQIGIYIAIAVLLKPVHPVTFSGALANVFWLLVLGLIVIVKEVQHFPYRFSPTYGDSQTSVIPSAPLSIASQYAMPAPQPPSPMAPSSGTGERQQRSRNKTRRRDSESRV